MRVVDKRPSYCRVGWATLYQPNTGLFKYVFVILCSAPATFVTCNTLTKTIALCGYKPGLGPATEILSLLRQRKYSKKGDRRLAPFGSARLCEAKNGKCPKLAALKQRTLLFPFSASHKRLRPKRTKVKNRVKSNCNINTNATEI